MPPRRVVGGPDADTQGCGGEQIDHAPAAEEDADRGAGGSGERERPTFAGSEVINESNAESQGHRIKTRFRSEHVRSSRHR